MLKSIRLGVAVAVLLIACAPVARAQADSPEAGPMKAVQDYIDAIRKGDAAAMKALMLPAVRRTDQDILTRGADTLATVGPKFSESMLKPPGDAMIEGDLAVVTGGFGTLPYMRLIQKGNDWKLLLGAADEVRSLFGLTDAQAAAMKRLDAWARSQRDPNPAPAAATPDRDTNAVQPAPAEASVPPAEPDTGVAIAPLPEPEPIQTPPASAEAEAIQAVKDYLDAIRTGNAAAMKAKMLPAVRPADQTNLNLWADNVAMLGSKLGESMYKPAAAAAVNGELAVVMGGYGPLPYMRLLKKDDSWLLMLNDPARVQSLFGLSAAQMTTLRQLDAWAKSQVPPEPARPDLPVASDAAAGTQPLAARDRGKALASAVQPLLTFINTSAGSETWGDSARDTGFRVLLEAGYVDEARTLLPANVLSTYAARKYGQFSASLPGGPESAEARALLRKLGNQANQYWTGVAMEYVRRGDLKAGLDAASHVTGPSNRRTTLTVMLNVAPTEELVAVVTKEFKDYEMGYDAGPLLKAYIILGKPAEADSLLATLAHPPAEAATAASKPGLRALLIDKETGSSLHQDRFKLEMATEFAKAGDTARAEALTKDMKFPGTRVASAIMARTAKTGDAAAVAAEGRRLKFFQTPALVAYVQARSGDLAGAQQTIKPLKDEQLVLAYGMIAGARLDAGDVAAAEQVVAQAVQAMESVDARVRAMAFAALFDSAMLGPDALIKP